MDGSKIKMRSDATMSLKIDPQKEKVVLVIPDSLEASEEELEPAYKDKIAGFINAADSWYPSAVGEIRKEFAKPGDIRLTRLYVLSEQSEKTLRFGLSFRVEADVEHGRGMKIDGATFEILKYGAADVAFT
jgi:hypothetical protein